MRRAGVPAGARGVPETMSETHYHAVVWLDHREARVFHFNADDVDKTVVHPDRPHRHLHHKAGAIGAHEGHAAEDQAYYHAVAEALAGAREILVVGPGGAKLALLRHLHARAPDVEQRVVGIETVDHPSDNQLVAHARAALRAADRMRPQLG